MEHCQSTLRAFSGLPSITSLELVSGIFGIIEVAEEELDRARRNL